MKAFFTVEAACILPVVLGVYVFLIYGMFYQYDRCLLEQDVALLVLEEEWSAAAGTEDAISSQHGTEEYPAFTWRGDGLVKEQGQIKAWAEGLVNMPLGGLGMRTGNGRWELEVSFSCTEVRPAEWIRLSKKIMEEVENVANRVCEEP